MTMSEWSKTKLGNIAETTSGGTPDRKNQAFFGGSIPWVKSGELEDTFINDTEEKITPEGLKRSAAKLFPSGTLLMAMYGATVGKTALLKIEATTNQAVCAIFPRADQAGTDFLRYALVYQRPEILKLRYGGAQPNISQQVIRNLVVPLPPLVEQRKIASVLGLVQRAIEQQEQLVALTTELKKSLMHKLFTEGLRGERQKQIEIGPMPESWEVLKLGDLFDTQLGKMLSQKARAGDDPKPYLRNKNVQWGAIDTTDLLSMDFNERERGKFILVPGDLLICEGGEPGRAAIWRGALRECYYQKALHRLRPKSDTISNEFFAHLLEFALRYQDLYGVAGASSTIAHLPEVQLKMLPVPLPSRNEQDTMVESIDAVDNKIALHQSKHAALTALFRTCLHQLMTAQIRVHDLDLSFLEQEAVAS